MNKDLTTVLRDIDKSFKYDESSYYFVKSVCEHYIRSGKISEKQHAALANISTRIDLYGKQSTPVALFEPEEPGFLGINCKTGDVNFYSWQIFEKD